MTERQFNELRPYMDGGCLDNGWKPLNSLIVNGYLREVVRGCWEITPKGREAFERVRSGREMLRGGTW